MTDIKMPDLALLKNLIESESIENLSVDQILSSFVEDRALRLPTEAIQSQVDPRNGEPTLFNTARAFRPHDYAVSGKDSPERNDVCPICIGNTTGILDWAELSDGFTFINKNLYPVLNIADRRFLSDTNQGEEIKSTAPGGLHFVQWTSTFHDQDWHNMSLDDCITVMTRLAALEKTLVKVGSELAQKTRRGVDSRENQWFVSIIKNVGAAVGGSLEHGHQQIILGNITPRRIQDNINFQKQQGRTFTEFLLSQNPGDLLVRDYGSAVLLVPIYMRRPFDMILALKDTRKSYLHELARDELEAVTAGWRDATLTFQLIMPSLNREIAYNIITHNGPGAGLYFELLPYTQEKGGLEHLGMSICQADPYQTAAQIRLLLDQSD